MDFQKIQSVGTPDFYIDVAFRRATNVASLVRGKSKRYQSNVSKSKDIELEKLKMAHKSLTDHLKKILTSYPSIDSLPPFYNALVKCTIDYVALKKSLGAVNWCVNNIDKFYRLYSSKIKRSGVISQINNSRTEFYGRVSSLLKQIKFELKFLEEARKVMRTYPDVKPGLKTVAIAGFPNVGKTTLLYKLTGSKAEIQSYAFTTKGINVGNAEINREKVQFLDTPGTLNRFDKMNDIEKQAVIVLKHLADVIIYVFDATEPYPMSDQINLYNNLKKLNKKTLVYLSKTDVLDKKVVAEFKKRHDALEASEIKKMV